ncbi:MAG TPA: helix-turn-helix domain-containing protein [Gemmatimonadaceae bacterium]|nr:helix-turn-helix domain-containing protein [Gemmatimonadaceae bacterium]
MTPIAHVQSLVCDAYGITHPELIGKRRFKTQAEARNVAMFLCRIHLPGPPSFPEIARAFGGRDHTTVMAAVKSVLFRMGRDSRIAGIVAAIAVQIGTAPSGRSDISLMPLARIDLDPAWEAERAARFAGGAG